MMTCHLLPVPTVTLTDLTLCSSPLPERVEDELERIREGEGWQRLLPLDLLVHVEVLVWIADGDGVGSND